MITKQLMESLFPTKGLSPKKFNLVRQRDQLIEAMNRILPKYEINTYSRVCAFLSNCGIETDYFRTTEEYASGWDYDISVNPAKARALGNFKKGDGPRYKGSGLSQTTGGYNFGEVQKLIGEKLGINVLRNPEILREDIDVAVESACIFWQTHNLNAYADQGQFKHLSGIVNRGDKDLTPLHWTKRNELYSLCKRRVPADFSFSGSAKLVDFTSTGVPQQIESEVEAAQPTTLKEIGTTVFLHTPKDTIKNICVVIGTRVLAGLVTLWSLGLHGKIFLVALAAVTSVAVAYACIKYAPRLLSWSKQGLDYIFS